MTRHWVVTALLLVFASTAGAAEDVSEMIRRGIALHDQGRYAEAIEVYRDVLRIDPTNDRAFYELTFSLFSSGDAGECATNADRALRAKKKLRVEFFTMSASCLDELGKPGEALRVCKRGLREFPRDSTLAFNCAATSYGQKDFASARRLLKVSLAGRPLHASSHLLFANALASDGYRVPALMAALRFLSLEPSGPRAKGAAALARHLLEAGVTRRSDTNIEVQIDAKPPTDEGDFSSETMILPVLSSVRFTDEGMKKNEIEQIADEVSGFLSVMEERASTRKKKSFVRDLYQPFLLDLNRAKLAEAFAYFVFSSLELPGTADWTNAHGDEMQQLRARIDDQGRAGDP